MSSVRVSMSGDLQEMQEKLSALSELDKAGLNHALAEALRSGTIDRFERETAPDGAKWKRSIRASAGGMTLTDSGSLKSSIHARATAEGAEVGTNLIYAATHQFGASGRVIRAKTPKGLRFQHNGRWIRKQQVTVNIPERPFLGVSDEDAKEIRSMAEEAIAEA